MEKAETNPVHSSAIKNIPLKTVIPVFLIVALTLVISFGLIYRNSMRLMNEDSWVSHTHEVISEIEALLSDMIDVETGQRGFVLSGNPDYLEPFNRAQLTIDERFQNIRSLTADNPHQQALLKEAEPLIRKKLEISKNIVAVRQQGGLASAASLVSNGEGKKVMDSLRAVIGQMLGEERRLLLLRLESSRQISESANFQFILISLIDIIATAAALWAIYSNTYKRLQAEAFHFRQQKAYVVQAQAAAEAEKEARLATERTKLFREEVLANMYHELRTPLTAIVGYSEVLKSDCGLQ